MSDSIQQGRALAHDSARLHVTGRATFTDDAAPIVGELYAAVAGSSYAHARIKAVDISIAAQTAGVQAVLLAGDVPGDPDIGSYMPGDPVLAADIVEFVGQPVALVVADDLDTARHAAALIEVQYEPLEAVLDVATAIERELFVSDPYTLERGNTTAGLESAQHRLEGELTIGGQQHVYIEGQIARAIPQDDGGMLVYSATQHPTEVQHLVAKVLGLSMGSVTVEVRRMGGAFGGKETQATRWACLAALGARHLDRPVRFRLPRTDDMAMTGNRHGVSASFRAGFDEVGALSALEIDFAFDCGHSPDMSSAVVWVALCSTQNCYYLANARLRGYPCKTHKVTNTAFRGFGAPQGVLVMEHILDRIAEKLSLEPLEVRRANFYAPPGKVESIYGQHVEDNVAPELMEELAAKCLYRERSDEIELFNAASPIIKRGIALTPIKHGTSLPRNLAQGGALVHIYHDGSIHLNHGGTEMGQGLFIKCAQVIADELQVDLDRIQISSARTDKVPNTSATAGSTGTDINGMAARDAARKLKARLIKFAAKRYGVSEDDVTMSDGRITAGTEDVSFDDLVGEAYNDRVQLSATGFYEMPKIWFDFELGKGRPFYYFAHGAGCSEVVIDTLTGEYAILRVDLIQDVGRSLNPAIDLGQVEGAFIQGVGWLTSEELVWDSDGRLLTEGLSTYKIPTIGEMPLEFNVELAANRVNSEDTPYRSKAVGEPPLLTSISVFSALRRAIAATADHPVAVGLDAPATPEQVYKAVQRVRTV